MMGAYGRRRWNLLAPGVLALAGMASLTACESQSLGGQGECGDGVATGDEECDGMDLWGTTCADWGSYYSGYLQCNSNCTFNTSHCGSTECSDGIVQFGETCDCGADPTDLPTGCTDINGSPDANCTVSCIRIDLCGDGIVSGDEECDCGWSPDLQPADCSDVNGAPGGGCSEGCQWSQGN